MKRMLAVLAVLFLAAAAAAAQADRVQLLRAEYGVRGSSVDVTDRVRSLVRDGVLSIRVDNDTLGGDTQVSSDYANQGDQLQILNASYGAGDRRRDVTSIVASQVQGNTLQWVVSNRSLGGDPAEGQPKRLRIVYFWRGLRNQITAAEGEQISIP